MSASRGVECKSCGSDDWYGLSKFKCKPCSNKYSKEYKKRNRLNVKLYNKKYCEDNKKILKEKRDLNKEHINEYSRKYRKEHSAKYVAHCASRRARQLNATPSWFNKEEIDYIYSLAKDKGLVVDHLVPLTSELVCGLHVQDNLRCIPDNLNASKRNYYWPDMWK